VNIAEMKGRLTGKRGRLVRFRKISKKANTSHLSFNHTYLLVLPIEDAECGGLACKQFFKTALSKFVIFSMDILSLS
jgi:hypothetical protein